MMCPQVDRTTTSPPLRAFAYAQSAFQSEMSICMPLSVAPVSLPRQLVSGGCGGAGGVGVFVGGAGGAGGFVGGTLVGRGVGAGGISPTGRLAISILHSNNFESALTQ